MNNWASIRCIYTLEITINGYGAAISLISSNVTSSGELVIRNNKVCYGAVFAFDSKLHFSGDTTVLNNYGWTAFSTIETKTFS